MEEVFYHGVHEKDVEKIEKISIEVIKDHFVKVDTFYVDLKIVRENYIHSEENIKDSKKD